MRAHVAALTRRGRVRGDRRVHHRVRSRGPEALDQSPDRIRRGTEAGAESLGTVVVIAARGTAHAVPRAAGRGAHGGRDGRGDRDRWGKAEAGAEARAKAWATRVGAAELGNGVFIKVLVSGLETPNVLPSTSYHISETIAMQQLVRFSVHSLDQPAGPLGLHRFGASSPNSRGICPRGRSRRGCRPIRSASRSCS